MSSTSAGSSRRMARYCFIMGVADASDMGGKGQESTVIGQQSDEVASALQGRVQSNISSLPSITPN